MEGVTPGGLITLGIITYNAEKTISRALKSALFQTWQDVEIIVVDDASGDSTLEIVGGLLHGRNKFKIIANKRNQGVAKNRQTILENATGQFISFLDDDDVCCPDRLEKQAQRIIAYENLYNREMILCFGDRKVIDSCGHEEYVEGIGRSKREPYGPLVVDALIARRRATGYSWGKMGAGTMMARTSSLRRLGFDTRFRRAAEVDLAVRAAIAGYHFISVPRPVITQYLSKGSEKTPSRKFYYQSLILLKNWKALRQAKVPYKALLTYELYVVYSYIKTLLVASKRRE